MIKINTKLPISYNSEDIKNAAIAHLPISREEIKEIRIVKRSLNLSDKTAPFYDVTLALAVDPQREQGLLKMRKKVSEYPDYTLKLPQYKGKASPIVVGAGPAGLFAALVLSECGGRPILIERGRDVDERAACVNAFNLTGFLDSECNVQFGEGGAGTYSDGKLKVGAMDKYKMKIINEFIDAGANEDIAYSTTAHLGTDKLSSIIKKIREKIVYNGGQVRFSTKLTDIKIKDGAVYSVVCESFGKLEEIECESIILATGHSAEDTFRLLYDKGVAMEPRGFGIGVRIEHQREYINRLVYGENYNSALETASYHLVTHLDSGRSVYSFCMCPGGDVVAAASQQGGIVTNGMSEYLRDGENSNAAFLVSVTEKDFASGHPLAGIELQRKIERGAFSLTNSYKAPYESLYSLKTGEKYKGEVNPTYPLGVENFRVEEYMPNYICESLRMAIVDFDSWMPGFYCPDGAVTGPETRTTSPVKILRSERGESFTLRGLYPTGEGAGYAGGIISSARDGIMMAEKLIENTKK